MSDAPSWSHHNPVRIVCAPLEGLAQHISARHVLLVTTTGFLKRGIVQRLKDILAAQQVTVWDGVKPNPDMQDLDVATQHLRTRGIDCVVGLGGGSALDTAKILASTIPSPTEPTLRQVFRDGFTARWMSRLQLVTIPTTSGTGAEVTPFATIWDHEEHKKYSLSGEFVYPDLALLDATLTLTLGYDETLYPALDSISHALESLWNKNRTPVSQALALQALALSNKALPIVIIEPQNLDARRDLQTASLLAGLAISQTKTALAHAISYPLTTRLGVPHGLACSFTLPKLLNWFLPEMLSDGLDEAVLLQSLSLLEELRLHEKITKIAKPESVKSMQNFMVSKGRSENLRYVMQQDLDLLISHSLARSCR